MNSQKSLKRKSQDMSDDTPLTNGCSASYLSNSVADNNSTDDELNSLLDWIVDAIETNSSVIDHIIDSIVEPTADQNPVVIQDKQDLSMCGLDLNEDFWDDLDLDMTPNVISTPPQKDLDFTESFQNLLSQLLSGSPLVESRVPSDAADWTLRATRLIGQLDSIKYLKQLNPFYNHLKLYFVLVIQLFH